MNEIRQPLGSAIYFAVDYNASQADLENYVIPYFKGVKEAMGNSYKIGAYGSGLVVNTLRVEGLCEFRWLSESSSYYGTQEAIDNGAYELHQIYVSPAPQVCGIDVDYDTKKPETDNIGAFTLNEATS